MATFDDLVAAAYDYLAGRRTFADLYAFAAEHDPELFFGSPESLAARVSGVILLGFAEEAAGTTSQAEIRERIADLLREEALRHLEAV